MKRSGLMVVSAVAALLGFGRPAVAQQSVSCPPVAGEPYITCQVDRPPRPDSRNAPPRYPDIMLEAGMGGTVRVRFVVDTTGRVNWGAGIEFLASSHDMFRQAVKNALPRWSFEPGLRNGRSVAVRFEQVFDFLPAPNADDPPGKTMAIRVDSVPDGVPRMVIGTRGPDPAAAASFTQSDLVDAQLATLLTLAPAPIVDSAGRPRVTVCVTLIRDGQQVPGDPASLSALAAPGRRAVAPRDCPRTYASMIYDPRKRPPRGWIDPSTMIVTRLVPWNAETVLLNAEVAQGAGATGYRCTVTRDATAWRPACRRHGGMIS